MHAGCLTRTPRRLNKHPARKSILLSEPVASIIGNIVAKCLRKASVLERPQRASLSRTADPSNLFTRSPQDCVPAPAKTDSEESSLLLQSPDRALEIAPAARLPGLNRVRLPAAAAPSTGSDLSCHRNSAPISR